MDTAPLSFAPSRVDGLDDVSLVTIHSDRIVFDLNETQCVFMFRDFGRSVGSVFDRIKDFLCFRHPWRIVGERDWFHAPPDRFFRFYTDPQITVYMPDDDVREYGSSVFCRVQQIWRSGRVDTFDLG